MELEVMSGTKNLMSRWRMAGRASLCWDAGAGFERRTFEEDLELFESQIAVENIERLRPAAAPGLWR